MRNDRERLRDILEAIDRIEKYTASGQSRFEENELIQVWFVQHLQIIGEASRSLSQSTRDLAPEIPWRQIIGMRNILTHAYFEIDLDTVWSTVSVNVPELKTQIEKLLDQI